MQSEVISPKPKSGQEAGHHLYLAAVSPIWMRCQLDSKQPHLPGRPPAPCNPPFSPPCQYISDKLAIYHTLVPLVDYFHDHLFIHLPHHLFIHFLDYLVILLPDQFARGEGPGEIRWFSKNTSDAKSSPICNIVILPRWTREKSTGRYWDFWESVFFKGYCG